jgi:Flp pilus assembly protein TadD
LIGQRDAEAAGREFRRALELNPAEASAHWGLARVHARAGRVDSAHAAMARAREICGTPGCGDGLAVRE